MLDSPERRAEIWYSPAATPLEGTDDVNSCFDGASSLMLIRQAGQPDAFIVQSLSPALAQWRPDQPDRRHRPRLGHFTVGRTI